MEKHILNFQRRGFTAARRFFIRLRPAVWRDFGGFRSAEVSRDTMDVNPRSFMEHRLLIVSIAVIVAANVFWIAFDAAPPLWDMAGHSYRSAQVAEWLSEFHLRSILEWKTLYPPFPYLVTGLVFLVTQPHTDVPQYSLVLWTIVMMVAVYDIALHCKVSRPQAVLAALLTMFAPLTAHFGRIYDLDFPLAASTTAAVAALLRTAGFRNLPWSLVFGVLTGIALLTKWTAILFITAALLPVLVVHWRTLQHRNVVRNIALALLCAVVLAGPWYALHARDVLASVQPTTAMHEAVAATSTNAGDSTTFLWHAGFYFSWITRAVGWPIALWFFVSLYILLLRRVQARWFLLSWLGLSYLAISFVVAKEGRYLLPLLPVIALITAVGIASFRPRFRRILFSILLLAAFFVWIETSTGIRFLPQPAYQVLGLSRAYGYTIVTPERVGYGFTSPERYHGNLPDIAAALEQDVKTHASSDEVVNIAVVPNSIFFTAQQFQFYHQLAALRSRSPIRIDYGLSTRVREKNWRDALERADYVMTKTGDQGPAVWGPLLTEVAAAEKEGDPLFTHNLTLIGMWTVQGIEGAPQTVRLYRATMR